MLNRLGKTDSIIEIMSRMTRHNTQFRPETTIEIPI